MRDGLVLSRFFLLKIREREIALTSGPFVEKREHDMKKASDVNFHTRYSIVRAFLL